MVSETCDVLHNVGMNGTGSTIMVLSAILVYNSTYEHVRDRRREHDGLCLSSTAQNVKKNVFVEDCREARGPLHPCPTQATAIPPPTEVRRPPGRSLVNADLLHEIVCQPLVWRCPIVHTIFSVGLQRRCPL